LRRQSDPVIPGVFAPWRLCVKELNGMNTFPAESRRFNAILESNTWGLMGFAIRETWP
jgi:hypothetical protein